VAQPTDGQNGSLRVEGAELSPDWIKQLQIWWDVHAFYPKEASTKNVSGTVKMHLWVRPDGVVWTGKVEQSSGSEILDEAAYEVFLRARLRPFPPGTPAPRADIYITMHYVLANRQAGNAPAPPKRPFTITSDQVQATAVDTMKQKICTGTLTEGYFFDSQRIPVEAIFYRAPDGTPWVKWTSYGGTVIQSQVTEIGTSAQWTGMAATGHREKPPRSRFAVWPVGDNHLSGRQIGWTGPPAAIDLFCK
jgi:TonB family protein